MANDKTAEELAEEAAAASRAEAENNGGNEDNPDENEGGAGGNNEGGEGQPKPAVKPNVTDAAEIARQVTEALKNKELTPEQREQQLKDLEEASGFNRKQLMFFSQAVNKAAVQHSLPALKELGKTKAEKVLGGLSEALMAKVVEEMEKYTPEVQANASAWEQAAYLIKGKFGDTVKPTQKSNNGEGNNNQRKVVGGGNVNNGLSNGGTGGSKGGNGSGKKIYDENEQKMINIYFGGSAEEYEKHKKDKTIQSVNHREQAPSGGSVADKEYHRLTGGLV